MCQVGTFNAHRAVKLDPQRNMYFSLNFRWPLLMGNGCAPSGLQTPAGAPHSAFKALPAPPVSCPNSLPPISSLRGEREPGEALHTSQSALQRDLEALHSSQSALQQSLGHDARGPRPGHSINPQNCSDMKTMCGIPPMGNPNLGLPAPHGHTPVSHPTPHPAFPLPLGSFVQPPGADPLGLQHLMGGNKALALSHYLADPLAKAALMDLGRYGHYPLGKKLFGCPQCRYVTDRKNNLKRHVSTMHQECDKVLECCGVVFKNKASLRDHVLIFHSNGYMCRFCGRNFCRKALLKRHLTVHSGQKDYVCSLCDYATSHKSNLERHKKVHERQGSDQEDQDSQPEHSPSVSFSTGHGDCSNSCPPMFNHSLSDAIHGRGFHSHMPAMYPGLKPENIQPGLRIPSAMGGHAASTPSSLSTITSPNGHHFNRGQDLPTSSMSSLTSSLSAMTSSLSAMTSSSISERSLTLTKPVDSFDLHMASLASSDVGRYSVERILNTCKTANGSMGMEGIHMNLDDDEDDPRTLLTHDVSDDDEDTHSSDLIDVVHVDLHE